jgi:hypothetical protein
MVDKKSLDGICRAKCMMLIFVLLLLPSLCSVAGQVQPAGGEIVISGELKQWHRVTLTFDGPSTTENADPNPFLDFRLNVFFANGSRCYTVPGFFAADGNAAQSSAARGNKWRVHFTPDATGTWTYIVSFRIGREIAIDSSSGAGEPGSLDGLTGSFAIGPTDKRAPDFRAKGFLLHGDSHYLRFSGTGEYYIKTGSDSPENFLGYADFDGTFNTSELTRDGASRGGLFIHHYEPHIGDWKQGDPTWMDRKGKSIIGALNYLSSKGVNSLYFISYNLDGGDGKDVWPWTGPNDRMHFDCSKLDQWEIVFSQMDKLGIAMHWLTQETENDQGLDGGGLGIQRKLYYRELIARFAHHIAIVWNLGEENTNTTEQQRAFANYFMACDPYKHPVVMHTFPGVYDRIYNPLLAHSTFDGPSLQMNRTGSDTHSETLKWVTRSAMVDHKWFVCLDEFGNGANGVKTDALDPSYDEPRINCLWGNLMAGGAGVEWYFGYQYPHNDLNCEDFRSRDHLWDITGYAAQFFKKFLPFYEMASADSLVSNGWCLAKQGEVYAIYLQKGGVTELLLPSGNFVVRWFNPRTGGELLIGSVQTVKGPGKVDLGHAPKDNSSDWVILVKAQ